MQNAIYEAQLLPKSLHKIFTGVYSDFRNAAIRDYMFEIEPMEYDEFLSAVEEDLIKCIVLLENQIPTAFLIYTCAISEAVELNVIHCLGSEDVVEKRKILMEKFLELTQNERKNQVVCYPMLGSQKAFAEDITNFGFKLIGIVVLRFYMNDAESIALLESAQLNEIEPCYEIVPWKDEYFEDAVNVIHNSFKTASDALFDPRFTSESGTRDILRNIVDGIYGEFLPQATATLLYEGKPVGFCILNITGGSIANIALVGIDEQHRGKGLSKHMLKQSVKTLLYWAHTGEKDLTEVNTCTETDNAQALKMYRTVGFKEDYSYPQSYLPINNQ